MGKVKRKKAGKDEPRLPTEDEARFMTDQFYAAEPISEAINDVLIEHQPSPLAIAFAFLTLDRFLVAQIKDWAEIRALAKNVWDDLDKAGELPVCNADGTVTAPGEIVDH